MIVKIQFIADCNRLDFYDNVFFSGIYFFALYFYYNADKIII